MPSSAAGGTAAWGTHFSFFSSEKKKDQHRTLGHEHSPHGRRPEAEPGGQIGLEVRGEPGGGCAGEDEDHEAQDELPGHQECAHIHPPLWHRAYCGILWHFGNLWHIWHIVAYGILVQGILWHMALVAWHVVACHNDIGRGNGKNCFAVRTEWV